MTRPEPPPPPPVVVEEVIETADGETTATSTRLTLRWLFWRGVLWLLVAHGILTLANLMPPIVEVVYSQGIYFYIARWLSIFSRFFSFSVGEASIGAIILWFISWTVWYGFRAFRREARFFDIFKLLSLHVLWTFSSLFAIFLILWGINYARMPIDETARLDRRPARTDELQAIGARIVAGINRNYAQAAEGQDWPRVSRLPLTMSRLNQSLENSFGNTAFLDNASKGGVGFPKPLYLSALTSALGISGIYMPFTGETTYNVMVPANELPFVIANQKAHQRGYAREDEANFVAYVICTNAEEPYVRYSGFLHAVKVLDVIERANVGRFKDQIGPGPSYDLEASRQFWLSAKNPSFGTASDHIISAFLRLNRVRRGIENYDEDIPLIIAYYLKNDVRRE